MDGTVYDLQGNPIERVADLEAAFIAAIETAMSTEPVYVVTDGSRPSFDEQVRALDVPVVVDKVVGERALIIAGDPSEWETL